MLKTRIRTTGLIEARYDIRDVCFEIHDVGGVINERRKWIHTFENVTAVIFVAALDHYNNVLFENESWNSMHESIQLFDELVHAKWFKRTEFILLLNRKDLFEELIRAQVSLSNCFSTKYGWDGEQWDDNNDYAPMSSLNEDQDDRQRFEKCYDLALDFIRKIYISKNRMPDKRRIFCHVTNATDRDHIERVFWDIQNIIMRSNLKRAS